MSEKITSNLEDDLREEYDLSKLKNPVIGKHSQQYQQGHSVTIHHEDKTTTTEIFAPESDDAIILDPDVKIYFPDSQSVNSTLRSLINLIPKVEQS